MIDATDEEIAALDIGSSVVTLYDIGIFKARVHRGTAGVVAGRSPDGELEIRFDNGRRELVQPHTLARTFAAADPAADRGVDASVPLSLSA